jgi:hypothetical protein
LGVLGGFIGFIGGYIKYFIRNIKLYKNFLSIRMQRFTSKENKWKNKY